MPNMNNDLDLTRSEYRLLKAVEKGRRVNADKVNALISDGLVECKAAFASDELFAYSVTTKGRRYIAVRDEQLRDVRFTRWIAALSLSIAALSLVVACLSLGLQLLELLKP